MLKKVLTVMMVVVMVFSMAIPFMAAEATTVNTEGLSEATPGQQFMSIVGLVGPILLIGIAFYFFLIRPQRKQEKEVQKMRSGIEVGDQITTIGGITGYVRQIKDDDIYIIETAADKSKIAVRKWAIQSKETISDDKA